MNPAISVRNLSKCYRIGVINRHTLVDEAQYWWLKLRKKDPKYYFNKIAQIETDTSLHVEENNIMNNRIWALKDVSFDIPKGEVIGIIGRNGAGKSTLLKILSRITEPTSGEAIINGRVGSLLNVGAGFHQELTGKENIYMNGSILGMKKHEIDAKYDEIVGFSEIAKFIDTPVKRYSKGMYFRLAFAVAAHLDNDIMIIDEVMSVGDAKFRKKSLKKMREISEEGRTVLFVSHNMSAIASQTNRCLFLDSGSLKSFGKTKEVIKMYLN